VYMLGSKSLSLEGTHPHPDGMAFSGLEIISN